MRADRLVAIVLLLQTHGQLTAARLAELLETSERTVRRDLDALSAAGVPVYAQRGRGGGWALLGGHRIDLSGFTVDEARSLFLAAGIRGPAASDPGLSSALRKVLAALPEPLRAQASAATQAVVIDPAGWGRMAAPEPPLLGELRAAVLARVQVDLDYAKPGTPPERRRVHPYGLVAKGGIWYLLAGTDKGRRTYRLSRVHAVTVTDEPASLPPDFDLADEWASAQEAFVSHMPGVVIELDVAPWVHRRLLGWLRGWAQVVDDPDEIDGEGWQRLRLSVPTLRMAAGYLAGFGGDVRVRAPDELRTELVRIGEGLVAANARPTILEQTDPEEMPSPV